jgi:hypothetical protein
MIIRMINKAGHGSTNLSSQLHRMLRFKRSWFKAVPDQSVVHDTLVSTEKKLAWWCTPVFPVTEENINTKIAVRMTNVTKKTLKSDKYFQKSCRMQREHTKNSYFFYIPVNMQKKKGK